ncbi:hypothetical protein BGX38DRAFT_1200465 [Terfezia claveryi]|nr:hypothetical protein BGX38DRAFT_1200465 [Terfezia claveryi]
MLDIHCPPNLLHPVTNSAVRRQLALNIIVALCLRHPPPKQYYQLTFEFHDVELS